MSNFSNPSGLLHVALKTERPLQILGIPNPYVALMAEQAGFRALYLSGASISNFSYALPDLGLTTRDQVLREVSCTCRISALPLLVDIDTGWGDPKETVSLMEAAGAAAIHIEDQIERKKCGHLEGKQLVSTEEMEERIQAAVKGKKDPEFLIIARTDAFSVEGLDATLHRAKVYQKAGADFLFPEALTSLEEYRCFAEELDIPILANCTEFGKTPLFSTRQLAANGVSAALYPLSLSRIMNQAAWTAMQEIRKKGTQKDLIDKMQSREDLYSFLSYDAFQEEIEQWQGGVQ